MISFSRSGIINGPAVVSAAGLAALLAGTALISCMKYPVQTRPNIILVLTDDQGIGDLGCHGNPWLKTPNLDDFYHESVRLTDFHVSPLCTPTRSAIITGKYPIRNGAWATFKGRDAISPDGPTIAEIFRDNGYATAMFGKWHLGDNYPARPTDCGFDLAVQHKSGGVGELSDYWGNDYFDDTYLVNNEPRPFTGYCTDVWFSEAMKFIAQNRKRPFFIYLPTNAPHAPLIVDSSYAAPYREGEGSLYLSADYYGMLANIDENFGRLRAFLDENGLSENTILIFMTDNGTQYGYSADGKLGWNMGLRGRKAEKSEGGHRVPFFIRWPAAGIEGGRDVSDLAAHVDLFPTLAGLCRIGVPEGIGLDGVDLSGLLLEGKPLPGDRTVFIHHRQDWKPPMDVEGTCIARGKWRLISGKELYDVRSDPGQQNDVSALYPELVRELLEANRAFLGEAKSRDEYRNLPAAVVGTKFQDVTVLTIQHAVGDDRPVWRTEQVAAGERIGNSRHLIEVAVPGTYRISCARWPRECPGPIWGIPEQNPEGRFSYHPIHPLKVRLGIGDQTMEKEVREGDEEIRFELQLETGRYWMDACFLEEGEAYGVYYTYIYTLIP